MILIKKLSRTVLGTRVSGIDVAVRIPLCSLLSPSNALVSSSELVVLTGTSSGLGRKTALALLNTGEYHVIGAVRDLDKMEAVAEVDGFDMDNFTPMYCEMNSFESVDKFCENVLDFAMSKPIDRLICNAGIYQPSLPYAKWSLDDHEQTMQVNFLSHFLMISKLMPSLMKSNDPRVVMVGSVTGNDNTVGGGGVYPVADLHELQGFEKGFRRPVSKAGKSYFFEETSINHHC